MNSPEEPLPPYPFPGPDPVMDAPDENAVIKAEVSLARTHLRPNHPEYKAGISEDDAKALLQWLVYNTRESQTRRAGSIEKFCKMDLELTGDCDRTAKLASHPARLLRLTKAHRLWSYDIQEGDIYRHAFTVLKIPILKDGRVTETPYLLDTTYRQFFSRRKNLINCPATNPIKAAYTDNPGATITKSTAGRELADTLLSNGYAALDEYKAKLYIDSFLRGKELDGSYLQKLALSKRQRSARKILEYDNENVLTPLMKLRKNHSPDTQGRS